MLQRLVLVQVKATDNNSKFNNEDIFNKIRLIVYFLYRAKEITSKV